MKNAIPQLRPLHSTRYEVAAIGPRGERVTVAFMARNSRRALMDCVVAHADDLAALFGTRDIVSIKKDGASRYFVSVTTGWKVGFTGRTEREVFYAQGGGQ